METWVISPKSDQVQKKTSTKQKFQRESTFQAYVKKVYM